MLLSFNIPWNLFKRKITPSFFVKWFILVYFIWFVSSLLWMACRWHYWIFLHFLCNQSWQGTKSPKCIPGFCSSDYPGFTMVLDSPLPQFGPIWRKKSLSGRHFFLVRATMNIKPVLKSSWTKLKHRRCTKRPGELKHINILVLKKSILKKTKKNMETKKLQTLYTSHSLVLPIGHLKQFSLSL